MKCVLQPESRRMTYVPSPVHPKEDVVRFRRPDIEMSPVPHQIMKRIHNPIANIVPNLIPLLQQPSTNQVPEFFIVFKIS